MKHRVGIGIDSKRIGSRRNDRQVIVVMGHHNPGEDRHQTETQGCQYLILHLRRDSERAVPGRCGLLIDIFERGQPIRGHFVLLMAIYGGLAETPFLGSSELNA